MMQLIRSSAKVLVVKYDAECQCCRCLDACIAQLGERQTEDLKVPGSIPGVGTFFHTLPEQKWWEKGPFEVCTRDP